MESNWIKQAGDAVLLWLAHNGIMFTRAALTWTLAQFAIIVGAFGLALIVAHRLTPAFEAYIRQIEGRPRLLRFLAIILRRLKWIVFPLVLWFALLVMRHVTWPSRSYLIGLAASLATAWILISIASRAIRSRFIARVVAVAAWMIAALAILGLLNDLIVALDAVGIDFQGFRLTPLLLIKAVTVLVVLVWLAVAAGRFIDAHLSAIEDLSPSMQVLTAKLAKAGLIVAAVLMGLSLVGINLTAFAVFSGAVGLGVGFGLQKVVSNLISGVILLIDKSIKPGDVISVGDTYGRINELAARYASVISRDGREYLIPNEDLITSQVVNWSYSSDLVRLDLDFGVAYSADPHEVRKLAREVSATHKRVQAVPPPVCHITAFGDSSVNYKLRFWIRDPDKGTVNVRGDIFLLLWDALKEADMQIPFPQRDVGFKGPVEVRLAEPPKPAPKRRPRKRAASRKSAQ